MNPWDELARSIDSLQRLLIEGVKITSNALERIKHVETGKASGSASGDHPDPHPWASQEAPRSDVSGDGLRPAGAYASGDRRVRDEVRGEGRHSGAGRTDAPHVQAAERPGVAALTAKEIVCPICYLATTITLTTVPRTPSPSMLWYCHECKELSVFDENLDLRIATEAEKAKAGKAP